jgi:hypothetical protein
VTVLAMLARPTGGEGVKSGPIGLAVILVLCIAAYFLFKSMSKHLKRVRDDFPAVVPAQPTTAASESAASESAASESAASGSSASESAASGSAASESRAAELTAAESAASAPAAPAGAGEPVDEAAHPSDAPPRSDAAP